MSRIPRGEYEALMNKINEAIEVKNKVESYGGFYERVVQSDKLGYDWKEEYLGDKLLCQTYIPQENPVGTFDNPINYVNGTTPLIDNAFYKKTDGIYVYMDGQWAKM